MPYVVVRRLRPVVRSGLGRGRAAWHAAHGIRERWVHSALRRLPVATADRLVVHDGRLLNIRVRLPRSAGPAPAVVELTLTCGAYERSADLPLAGERSATGVFELAELAELGGDGPRLWRLGLRVHQMGGKVSSHRLYGRPSGRPYDGSTLAVDRCPDSGAGYALGATARGRVSLTVTSPRPCTQVTRVVNGWTGIAVSGRLVGAGPAGEISVTMSHRDVRLRLPAAVEGGRFSFTIPIEAIPATKTSWRFAITADGDPALPVGRYLSDLRRPDRTIRYPAWLVRTETGRLLRVQPGYSARGRLLLTCSGSEVPA